MKCLIVDDVPLNIIVVQKMLQALPLEFQSANNGKDACDLIHNGYQPDLMILDLMMPVMDGYAVIEEVRAGRCGRQDLPIIVLSALNRETDTQRALAMGATDYITKPVIMHRLLSTVRAALPAIDEA